MKKKHIVAAVITVFIIAVIGAGTFFIMKKKKLDASRHAEPQQSVEEILTERAKQAKSHLDTPLGKSFQAKNWAEFEKLYQSSKNFHELAEIIRANYIENQFKDFSKADMDQVFKYTLKTFN